MDEEALIVILFGRDAERFASVDAFRGIYAHRHCVLADFEHAVRSGFSLRDVGLDMRNVNIASCL